MHYINSASAAAVCFRAATDTGMHMTQVYALNSGMHLAQVIITLASKRVG